MKYIIASDSYKNCMSSLEVGNAIREGILKADRDAEARVFQVADGGEGTCRALVDSTGGIRREVKVTGPLGQPVTAHYGIIHGTTAVIEMAEAAGLMLVAENERSPLNTTTKGVGEMIKDAIQSGCRTFLIGVGGSCTNDGGTGMLTALGYRFLDEAGRPIADGAAGLKDLTSIDCSGADPALQECFFQVACDVDNPLCGPKGASLVFAPQKGASQAECRQMDIWLQEYADTVRQVIADADPEASGSGAAGGMGFALRTFLGAVLESGVHIVIEHIGIEKAVAQADLVIVGEGHMDEQSIHGKAPVGIAGLAKKYQKPVIALVGGADLSSLVCNEVIDAIFPIMREPASLEQALEPVYAKNNISFTAEQAVRLYLRSLESVPGTLQNRDSLMRQKERSL